MRDSENLYADIQQAFDNGRDVGQTFVDSANLILDLRSRMRTRSGEAPTVFQNRFGNIQNQFDSLINPISHSIKNNQSSSRAQPKR